MTEDTKTQAFDPSRFLTLVSGKEYLEVKWRLVWLRSEHPDALIETHMDSYTGTEAIFSAKITIPGGGSATGWGSEDAQGFGDFIEKAETKAIGRALAALGYGTQFTYDFDAPQSPQNRPQRTERPDTVQSPQSGGNNAQRGVQRDSSGSGLGATERQRGLIQALAREQQISGKALDELTQERTGQPWASITRQGASALIEYLREKK